MEELYRENEPCGGVVQGGRAPWRSCAGRKAASGIVEESSRKTPRGVEPEDYLWSGAQGLLVELSPRTTCGVELKDYLWSGAQGLLVERSTRTICGVELKDYFWSGAQGLLVEWSSRRRRMSPVEELRRTTFTVEEFSRRTLCGVQQKADSLWRS